MRSPSGSRSVWPLLKRIAVLPATLLVLSAHADPATDWNQRTIELTVAAGLGNESTHRAAAIAHTAAFQAVQALGPRASRPAIEAALAAAHCTALGQLLPAAQHAAADTTCKPVLAAIAAGSDKDAGVEAGERAAREVLARRADDGASAAETYRPFTTPGRFVPPAVPATPQWGQRKPWLMKTASQFRPPAPPALTSERWARDFAEVKALGSARSSVRSAEQTDIARFWSAQQAATFYSLLRGVAERPGRDLLRNVRLFAAFTQAVDDAMVAAWDAKYHYGFWRPITAIRNADQDGNDATEIDPGWTPLINTPVHPEYPCAACVQAGVASAILSAEVGSGVQTPPLAAQSLAVRGAARRWPTVDAMLREVSDARVLGGMHFRFSNEASIEMGRAVGTLALRHFALEQP